MKRKSNRIFVFTALAIGIGLTAMQANAEQGTFNLPFQAHWGQAVLQPGEYSLQIPLPMGTTLIYLHSGDATEIAMPMSTEFVNNPDRSYLHLSKVNGEYYVDEFQSASGKKFLFHKPRMNRSAGSGADEEGAALVSVAGN